MKYNYPVKYAAMPMKEQDDVVCYIVSKCYKLKDITKYSENGTKENKHEVVFVYRKGQSSRWERVVPSFNVMNYVCVNSDLVEKVFDSYEEALEHATQKNKKLCDKTLAYLPYSKDFGNQLSNKKDEFNDRLARYKMLEQQILANTSDLEPSKVKELKELIRNNKGKLEELPNTLYEYLKFYSHYSKFIMYSISLEQYNKLAELANNQGIFDHSKLVEKANPILYHKIEEENTMVINQQGNILSYINKWGGLESNDEAKIPPIELNAIDDETTQLFTTETLEDIILSFCVHEDIDMEQIQGPVLKKNFLDQNKK